MAPLTRRLASLEDEMRASRKEDAARWARLDTELEALRRRVTGADAGDGAAVPAPDDPAAVEKLRERWRGLLDESEKRLWAEYPSGPDPRGDPVAWSRFDDNKRAREALDRARDSAAVRALAEGEFKNFFKLDR